MNEKTARRTKIVASEKLAIVVPHSPIKKQKRTVVPEWSFVPRRDEHCLYSGLSRRSILLLVIPSKSNDFTPPVKSVMVRLTGNIRGRRLVSIPSLLDFLEREAAKQAKLKPAA